MVSGCKLRALCGVLLATVLAGCPTPPRQPPVQPVPTLPSPPPESRAYVLDADRSLLTVLVYPAGPLARVGHSHVIAARGLSGVVHYVPADVTRSVLHLRIPVAELTVDEPELRAREGPQFAEEVSAADREATRRNMLGAALLDGGRYPEIVLRSERLEATPDGLTVHAGVTIRGQERTLAVPAHYEFQHGELHADGELTVKQTDLGLTPFSAFLGALQVRDDMTVRFHLVASAGS